MSYANAAAGSLVGVTLILLALILAMRPMPIGYEVIVPTASTCELGYKVEPSTSVEIATGGIIRLEGETVGLHELRGKLSETFRARARRILFVSASSEIEYREFMRVLEVAKAEADYVAWITPSQSKSSTGCYAWSPPRFQIDYNYVPPNTVVKPVSPWPWWPTRDRR